MRTNHNPSLKRGTQVDFNVGQGLVVGRGVIADAEWDGGWLYRIEVVEGDPADFHRNDRGEFWACDFEVAEQRTPAGRAACGTD